jgi:hypothetical protein
MKIKLEELVSDKEKYLSNIHRIEVIAKTKETLTKIRQKYIDDVHQIKLQVKELFQEMSNDGVDHEENADDFILDIVSQEPCKGCGCIGECLCTDDLEVKQQTTSTSERPTVKFEQKSTPTEDLAFHDTDFL